ncbi:MAG: ZIP family metal transporter, partial [Actinomycetota bacterium]
LAIAFTVNDALGFAVFAALLVHAFSDGLNLVAFLIKNGKWNRKTIWLLGVDSLARVGGAALGTTLTLSENFTALYLAAFAGIIIYLATSHILPEAHARHSSRWTLVATITGVLVMWGLVSQLHAVHLHSHEEAGHTVESEHEDHDHEEGEKEDDHDHDHDHNE